MYLFGNTKDNKVSKKDDYVWIAQMWSLEKKMKMGRRLIGIILTVYLPTNVMVVSLQAQITLSH